MSIKGGDYKWLRVALERGDLPLVKATAAQLPAIPLADALEIALLVLDREPHNGQRAAVRWLGRLCLERSDVTLAQVRRAVDAFALLLEEPERAEAVLRGLADEMKAG